MIIKFCTFTVGQLAGICLFVGLAVSQIVPFQTQHLYDFETKVKVHNDRVGTKESSYWIDGHIAVQSAWNADDRQIISFQFNSLKLHVPDKVGHVNSPNSAQLDSLNGQFFYVLYNDNIPREFYTKEENYSLQNLQKAVASLFYVNFKDDFVIEEDVSGSCSIAYQKLSSTNIKKVKTDCANWALKLHRKSEKPFDVNSKSHQEMNYKFSQDGVLHSVSSFEKHSFQLPINSILGSKIESTITLKHAKSDDLSDPEASIDPETLAAEFIGSSLEAEVDGSIRNEKEETSTMVEFVDLHREELSDDKLGSNELSLLFTEFLPITKRANSEDLIALLKSTDHEYARKQLLDVMGAVQTDASYAAITSVFKFNKEDDFDYLERYLQASAVATRPNVKILRSLLKILDTKKFDNDKLKESALLAVSSMALRYHNAPHSDNSLYIDIRSHILTALERCSLSECKAMYIRCLRNLLDPSTIEPLLKIAIGSDSRLSVEAMKALKEFPIEKFTGAHQKIFEKIFYEISGKFDTSTRTIALDIMLNMEITKQQLIELIGFLANERNPFEIKTYLLQRLQMISERNVKFSIMFEDTLRTQKTVNNYNILAQKGLSTVLRREYSKSPSFNGSMISTQEVNKGILKRGLVEMTISAIGESINIFTLGLHTSGLSSFVGSDNNDEDENEVQPKEPITAGMEIGVLGSLLRPLEFFNGQAELMGHVWSGTASEPTTAYQATFQVHDHEEYIVLQNGATVYLRVISANSIDLNGQVQFSLWNRNAHTEIRKRSGFAIKSALNIGTSFVQLSLNLIATMQPDIALVADLDFYSDTKLCLQLKGIDSKISIRSELSQNLGRSTRSEKKSTNIVYNLPGMTMALNRKNSAMCNIILA